MKKNDFEDEKRLAEKAGEGDVKAFEILFTIHKSRIYNYALKMTADREVAKEITQEVFVRAYKNLGKLRQKEIFNIWIMKIAVNLVKDFFKRKAKDSAVFESNLPDDWANSPQNFRSSAHSPEEIVIKNEKKNAILRSLQGLKPDFREILLLYYVEGLSLRDISFTAQIPEGTVKSRLSRGRAELVKKIRAMGF